MKKRVFKISNELKKYIRLVLAKQNTPAHFFKRDGTEYVEVPLSGERFHEVVLRARCEKLTRETGQIHVTQKESENPLFMSSILPNGKGCFIVINKNYES